jgi:hypothetical protein
VALCAALPSAAGLLDLEGAFLDATLPAAAAQRRGDFGTRQATPERRCRRDRQDHQRGGRVEVPEASSGPG